MRLIEATKSDSISLSLVDPSSPLAGKSLSFILQTQKTSGKTADYIEQIRCNIYDRTRPTTTRPRKSGTDFPSILPFIPGEDDSGYEFVSRGEFEGMIADDRLLEWSQHSNGHYYGTQIPTPASNTSLGRKISLLADSISSPTRSVAVSILQYSSRSNFPSKLSLLHQHLQHPALKFCPCIHPSQSSRATLWWSTASLFRLRGFISLSPPPLYPLSPRPSPSSSKLLGLRIHSQRSDYLLDCLFFRDVSLKLISSKTVSLPSTVSPLWARLKQPWTASCRHGPPLC